MEKKKCDVAAYVWPAYTGDEPRTLIFWPAGEGEWESVRTAVPQFPGHLWPRKPMWGYVNEANPAVMDNQIDAAADHGISTFIYDWYWFDGRSFLSQCLENGFLKAKNRSKMKFFIMWANHDVRYTWDRRLAPRGIPVHIWQGRVPVEEFHEIGKYWIEHYFSQPDTTASTGSRLFPITIFSI